MKSGKAGSESGIDINAAGPADFFHLTDAAPAYGLSLSVRQAAICKAGQRDV
jgi:hypothetical protein